ncbi:hypothetical protein [Nonomuraea zeae]|uniref:Uncharacterized protein n=1 Tax=Nonomuraea zeae TaxID=1642303 RepID=A0A5S4F7F2_9ACTN|nr:hypothetical protein [Nonomuraea zeae]TMR12221.1 hypothetical protein ETD85_58540 [Nonomuraea zeae]
MPNGDDLDARFNELVAQIDAEEQRKMRASAAREAKAARTAGRTDRLSSRARGRAGASAPEYGPPPRRIGRGWLAMAAITAVLVAAGAVVTVRPDLLTPSGVVMEEETGPVAAANAPVEARPAVTEPVETGPVETEPSENGAPEPEQSRPPAGPFAGSPAEQYAEGAGGFVMPKAKALGGLSKKDVAKGLKRARDLLAAAHLDRRTLMGGKPAPFMKLLHPDERSWFRANLDRKGKRNTRSWVVSFAPKTAEPATDVIKVHGRSKLAAFKKGGRTGAKLTTNYLIVYAIHRPGRPESTIRLIRHHYGTVLLYRDTRGAVTWVEKWGGSVTPSGCKTNKDGFVHPQYPDVVRDGEHPTGTPIDPYDLDQPQHHDCRAAKRA